MLHRAVLEVKKMARDYARGNLQSYIRYIRTTRPRLLKNAGIPDNDREDESARYNAQSVAAMTEGDRKVIYRYLCAREEITFLEKAVIKIPEARIRKVKHAINVFNTTTEVEGTGMTIDEVLVYLSQLTAARSRYDQMRARLPKERINNFGRGSQIIEYTYANYDVEKAAEDYSRISDEQAKLQTALDVTNNTKTMEIVL